MRDVKNIFVTGRKNPDLDSVTSAIGYAELKNKLVSDVDYIPVVSGNVDLNTQKVLSYFNVPIPNCITDLNLRVEEIMTRNPILSYMDSPITEVFKVMLQNDLRVVPVADANSKFYGSFGMVDIAKKSVSSVIPDLFRKIRTNVGSIVRAVDGTVLNGTNDDNKTFLATVIMGVMDANEFIHVAQNFDMYNIIVILGNRADIQKKAIEFGVRCIVLVNGFTLNSKLLEEAKKKGVAVILSHYDAFAASGLVEWSVPVSTVCDRSSPIIESSALIDDVKEKVYSSRSRSVVVVDDDRKVVGIVTRTDIIKYNKRKVVLLDHSSSRDAPDGIFKCEILEILDHHKLGDIRSNRLTRYRIEPWGSTSSIIADEFFKNNIKPSKTSALLLAAGIIVNTECLSEEKTKEEDRKILELLCEGCDIKLNDLKQELKKIVNL